jgi:sulfur carrier protein ThiS
MKVLVKIYGTLRTQFPDYQPARGMEIEIPNGSRVRDLLAHLKIPESQGALVSVANRILKADDMMQGESQVNVLQVIGGG